MFKLLISTIIIFIFLFDLHSGPLLLLDSYSARSFGLNHSDTAEKGDLDSLLSNPSGMAGLSQISASFMYLPWYEDINTFSISFGYPFYINKKSYGALGLNMTTWSVSPFKNYDSLGNKLPDLSASDLFFNIGYGYPLRKKVDIGINLKYFSTRLDDLQDNGFAIDMGTILSFLSHKGLLFGISIQNMGFSQKYINQNSPLPLKIRLGTSYLLTAIKSFDLLLMMDINSTKNQNIKLNSGLEIEVFDFLKLRGGYAIINNNAFKISIGSGLNYWIKDYNLILDYSMIPLNELSIQHAFSLKFRFTDQSGRSIIKRRVIEMEELFRERRYTKAIEKANEVLSLDPVNTKAKYCLENIKKIYLKLAKIKKEKKDFKRSIIYWKRFLNLVPDNEEAISEISLISNIISDVDPPEIFLNKFSKTNTIISSGAYYTLSGKITDDTGIKSMKINNEKIKCNGQLEVLISHKIKMSKGENSIIIYAEDYKGNKTERIIKIISNFQ